MGVLLLYSVQSLSLQDPSWKEIVLGFRKLTQKELELFPGYRYHNPPAFAPGFG